MASGAAASVRPMAQRAGFAVDDMSDQTMGRISSLRTDGDGAFGIVQGHAAGHAEMGDQGLAVIQPDQEIFGAPIDRSHDAALDPLGKALGQRHPEVAAALHEADKASPAVAASA